MKKTILLYFIFFILVIGIISNTSCKRRSQQDPAMGGPAGFRIILSGTANPSTLYVPTSEPAVSSLITVTALNNDGTAAIGRNIVFQADIYGYFDNFQITDVRTTDSNGVVRINYFIPPATCIRGTAYTEIKATLVDDGRLDTLHAEIIDVIPIKIIHHSDLATIIIHGNVWTSSGEGLGEIAIALESTNGMESGVTVTRPSGSYEFYVTMGWSGTVTPESENFTFTPTDYTFSNLYSDRNGVDFVASFTGSDALTVDITEWNAPIDGGTQMVNVYNLSGGFSIYYMLLPSHNWIHVSPTSGNTPGSFVITVDPNTTGEDRSGNVTVIATNPQGGGEVTITINQPSHEVPGDATLAVDRTTLNISGESTTETINVYNSAGSEPISFIVTEDVSWLSVSALSGSTPTTLSITAEANIGGDRTGTVTLTTTSTGITQTVTITVNQSIGAFIEVDVTSRNVLGTGEAFIVNITNPATADSLSWALSNPDAWVTASPTTGTTPGQFTVTVSPNTSGAARSSVIIATVTSAVGFGTTATVTINQDP